MKKYLLGILLLFITVSLSAQAEDERDKFCGEWESVTVGYLTISNGNAEITSPIASTNPDFGGTLTISKVPGSKNVVRINGLSNTTAIVSGNSLMINPTASPLPVDENMSINATFNYEIASLQGNVIVFKTKITGFGIVNGVSVTINGEFMVESNKI